MSSSVDGLVSGLSTSSMITSLMQVEAAPQTRLKTKVSTAQTAVAAYQSVNAKILALKSATENVGRLENWRAIKATSSSTSVTASTSTNVNASTGNLTFDVKSLASKQSTTMAVKTFDLDGDGAIDKENLPAVTQATSITVRKGSYDPETEQFTEVGDPIVIDISADRSAAGIVKAINKAGVGVAAAVMRTSETEGVLQFTGAKTGAGNAFKIEGLETDGLNNNGPSTTWPNSAEIQVAGGGGEVYKVKSDTNTFANLMTGLTVTVSKKEDAVTIDVAADVDAVADKFKALVDAANEALTEIKNQTAYDASTKRGSPLTGDFSVRDMSQKILSAVSTGLSFKNPDATPGNPLPDITFGSLKQLGVELDGRTGLLKFEKKSFIDSYATDPARVQQAGMELGAKLTSMTDTMKENLKSIVLGRNNEIDSLQSQISNWDIRLAARKLALQKQYSNLESSLGKLKNQSTWLAGQLGGLG